MKLEAPLPVAAGSGADYNKEKIMPEMESDFAELNARKDVADREKNLTKSFLAYLTCVSLVVEHFDAAKPGTTATKDHLKFLLDAAVEQWIEEHPDEPLSVHGRLRAAHYHVLDVSE